MATDRGLVGSVQAFSYIDSSERWSRLSFVHSQAEKVLF